MLTHTTEEIEDAEVLDNVLLLPLPKKVKTILYPTALFPVFSPVEDGRESLQQQHQNHQQEYQKQFKMNGSTTLISQPFQPNNFLNTIRKNHTANNGSNSYEYNNIPFNVMHPQSPTIIQSNLSTNVSTSSDQHYNNQKKKIPMKLPTPYNNEGIFTAVYASVPVYEFHIGEYTIMKRISDDWINATHILKTAGLEKSQRTKLLDSFVKDKKFEKIQGGFGKFQGTWCPNNVAIELSQIYNVDHLLKPILWVKKPHHPLA
ncbi:hypothetical protein HK099_006178 [Clydaea vesicula]|uniref:HTH APSES-type domain-containing protein n=1 Tax=Clydaea vesicula TaxID=447962 RepID=A0AAD5XZ84_9FUNG|nr:hypothetical protein HK099_006178 [Clydaea vesicula]KAJ3393501.1 hypothetical protein HDU92_007697 [Lobulomyces angularis]